MADERSSLEGQHRGDGGRGVSQPDGKHSQNDVAHISKCYFARFFTAKSGSQKKDFPETAENRQTGRDPNRSHRTAADDRGRAIVLLGEPRAGRARIREQRK